MSTVAMPLEQSVTRLNTAPSDDRLITALEKYAVRSYSREMKLQCLRDELDYSIGLRTLNKLELRLEIGSVRRPPPMEVSQQAVIDEVSKDLLQLNGPAFVQTHNTVREIMHDHFDSGFTLRFPGHKKAQIPRVGLSSMGTFHEVSADGREKLSSQALQMGEIGLPIYAYKDKYSDNLLRLVLTPNSRTAAAGGHLHLDLIEETGCIPMQLTTDKGSEIGWQYAFQATLREAFTPDIDPHVYAVYMVLKSVHNTVIEGFWRWLRVKMGLNLKLIILRGKENHIFDSNVAFHVPLFYWIFVPVIQHELDEFWHRWNTHRIRVQPDKNMPSGHAPAHVLEHPSHVGGIDCRIQIPREAVDELREYLTEEVGSWDSHLRWLGVTVEFERMAEEVWVRIGSPTLLLESAWDVFAEMSAVIENY
ncbi:hypothetical protein B0H16DRAFT_1667713 [Mycena metata]|uniref:Integrase core domain-containing protein n=1 Tax=Mycena metata TaxID=1033252 RepID=A0AAD7H4N4_9AGAR|nr:hypothetical protein B0H16DRAFT_1667713 [Mycena metata]